MTAPGVERLNPDMRRVFVLWMSVYMTPAELVQLGLFVVEEKPGRRYAELVPGPNHPENFGAPLRLTASTA